MTTDEMPMLSNNTLALIALANEYCSTVEHARDATDATEFIDALLRLLPRIYISANDLHPDDVSDVYINDVLEEDDYNTIRSNVETLMGEDDTYLDVFEEDMKYSDTPIGASVAEGVADLFQVMYNFVETVREAPVDVINDATSALREDFDSYWSRTLCNVFRALNAVRHR